MQTITYGIDPEGYVLSRVGSEVAYPYLDFDHMKPENGFETVYRLGKLSVFALAGIEVKWTRKVPTEVKNVHREFWGMKPIRTN